MKSKYFFFTGFLLLALTVLAPVIIMKYMIDQRNPDAAEMQACCVPIPLAVTSFLSIIVGITRLINERSKKNSPSLTSLE